LDQPLLFRLIEYIDLRQDNVVLDFPLKLRQQQAGGGGKNPDPNAGA
jgi:hypothetical protein